MRAVALLSISGLLVLIGQSSAQTIIGTGTSCAQTIIGTETSLLDQQILCEILPPREGPSISPIPDEEGCYICPPGYIAVDNSAPGLIPGEGSPD
jgi:hypothetical protein